jgi:uncharacterized YigZ family protein
LKFRDSYYTLKEYNTSKLIIKRSTFIAQAFPLEFDQVVSRILDSVKNKFYDARHHPYSLKTGVEKVCYKTSDDGEPSGSSGKPILNVIEKYDLTNVLIVVTRYFGGIKLGVGGLRRAYFDAAEECIKTAKIIKKYLYAGIQFEFDYRFINSIMNLLEKEKTKINKNLSDEKVKLYCNVRLTKINKLKKDLTNITNGKIKFSNVTD